MTCYFAFWIPLVKKSDLPIIKEKLPSCKLKDIPEHEAVVLKARICKDTYNIHLFYKTQSEIAEKELIFYNEWRTKEGFLAYRLELPDADRDFFCEELSRKMHQAVYHYFKDFFHKHVFHHCSEDSLLPAYFSDVNIVWNLATKQIVLKKILNFYSLKFEGYLDLWENTFDRVFYEISQNKNVTKNVKTLADIIQTARNVFGEALYCDFLLRTFSTEISRKDRAGIRNTIGTLHEVHEKITYWYNYYLSKASFLDGKSGKKWGIIGVLISTVSIVLTLFIEFYSPDIEDIKYEQQVYQDSLFHVFQQQMTIENKSIIRKQDSVMETLIKIDEILLKIKRQNDKYIKEIENDKEK